jgi:hypothetical protein
MLKGKRVGGLKSGAKWRSTQALALAGLVAAVGVLVLAASWAAATFMSAEAENGTVAGGATVVNDSSASNGKAVAFGNGATPTPSPTPGPIPFNTCTNPTHTLPTNPSNPQDGITLSGYYMDTDTWNFGPYPGSQQTMYVCNYDNWYAMVNVNDNANDGAVKTYPDAHIDYNSPLVTSFHTIGSIYAHTMPANSAYDAAYDVWLNNYGVELMIWTQSAGRQAHVPGIPQVATVTLSGQQYNIHKSGTYIAYDMPQTRTSGNINILEIINDMKSRGYISSSATLTAIDYGVEVCDTGGVNAKFEFNNFSITTN